MTQYRIGQQTCYSPQDWRHELDALERRASRRALLGVALLLAALCLLQRVTA